MPEMFSLTNCANSAFLNSCKPLCLKNSSKNFTFDVHSLRPSNEGIEMFFVAYNNKYIQNREIIPYKEHYVLSIRLYKEWYKFRQKHGIKSPYENNPLDYEKLLKEIK